MALVARCRPDGIRLPVSRRVDVLNDLQDLLRGIEKLRNNDTCLMSLMTEKSFHSFVEASLSAIVQIK